MPRMQSPIGPANDRSSTRRKWAVDQKQKVRSDKCGFLSWAPQLPNKSPASPDESSSPSSEGSATPSFVLKTACTVVWSNPAYRSELVSNSGSSSSSEGSTSILMKDGSIQQHEAVKKGDTDFSSRSVNLEFSSSTNRKVRAESPLTRGSTSFMKDDSSSMHSDLESLTSTKKTLYNLPAFREACEEDERAETRSVEEGWVHGPDLDIEGELFTAVVEMELEDEADQKLEAELESGIESLSRKLAGIQSQREREKTAAAKPVASKINNAAVSPAPKLKDEKPRAAAGRHHRGETRKPGDQNKTTNGNRSKEKSKENPPEKSALSRMEEQLKTLRLSPHFWGRNFDWVKSLRGGAKANVCPVKNTRSNRVVFGERNGLPAVESMKPKQQQELNQLKENKTRPTAQRLKQGSSKEVNPPVFSSRAGDARMKSGLERNRPATRRY